MTNYTVPAAKAANIRLALSKVVANLGTVPVKYARRGKLFGLSPSAVTDGIPYDPARCVEACRLTEIGTPGIVMRREAYVLEHGRTGKPVVMVYSKSEEATDHFDKTKEFKAHTFELRAWPKSWFPEARVKLAARRAKLRAEGKLKTRGYKSRKPVSAIVLRGNAITSK